MIDISPFVTVRFSAAVLTSFIIVMCLMPIFIRLIKKLSFCQVVREDGPVAHVKKNQTPTMGGALMFVSSLASILLYTELNNLVQGLVLTMCLFMLIGGVDDLINIKKKSAYAMTAKMKFFCQCTAAIAVLFFMWMKGLSFESQFVPFKGGQWVMPLVVACIGSVVVMVGSSNAVNLTDGLDGLASVPLMIVFLGLAALSYASCHQVFAEYLSLSWRAEYADLAICAGAFIGSLAGFLWYNIHPAEIFMGDVGSLMFGAVMAYMALVLHQVFIWALMSGLFIIEVISVMIQVMYFKATRKRFFLMAPIHHHFELKGWSEQQVNFRFWMISLVFFMVALMVLRIG